MDDMLTNTRLMLDATHVQADGCHERLAQLFRRATRRAAEMRCGITGHNVLLRYERTRLSLQCSSCGYESPGWDLAKPFSPPVTV
jgi:hypothetical protein